MDVFLSRNRLLLSLPLRTLVQILIWRNILENAVLFLAVLDTTTGNFTARFEQELVSVRFLALLCCLCLPADSTAITAAHLVACRSLRDGSRTIICTSITAAHSAQKLTVDVAHPP